jgi:nicotinate phosphoribosyltransferase
VSVALLTDRYELTMLEAALSDGTAQRQCIFEVFARRLPPGRRYGVVAGQGRLLELLPNFRFDQAEVDYLVSNGIVGSNTGEWLANFRFTGNIVGYREGEIYFPGSPVLTISGTFAETVLLETLVLSVLNHDSAVASAASRMTVAAGQRPCLEMGARRTHEQAALAAARAAQVGGFAGTSVLEAGRRWGIETIGTAAHAFTLLHDDEQTAFAAQIAAQGPGTTLLVDTFDVAKAVRLAIAVAGPSLRAVRLDSGDLTVLAGEVRSLLDSLGATNTGIIVTSDLDEYAIAGLAAAPVTAYGVGTRLVTGSGAPTAEFVYKLVARQDSSGSLRGIAKIAGGSKATVAGAKQASRGYDQSGRAVAEILQICDSDPLQPSIDHSVYPILPSAANPLAPDQQQPTAPHRLRPLTVPLVQAGIVETNWTGAEGLRLAAEHHRTVRSELPRSALRLSAGEAAIPTQLVSR